MSNKEKYEEMLFQIETMYNDSVEGVANALDVYIFLDSIKKTAEAYQKNLKESAITEFEKYPEKKLCKNGFKISKENRTTYTYNFADIDFHNAQIKECEDKMKFVYNCLINNREIPDSYLKYPAAIKRSSDCLVIKT